MTNLHKPQLDGVAAMFIHEESALLDRWFRRQPHVSETCHVENADGLRKLAHSSDAIAATVTSTTSDFGARLARARRRARLMFDSLFCETVLGIVPFGKDCLWHVHLPSLQRTCRVISGGVGNDISFEKELAFYMDAHILLLDPSPTGAATMGRSENRVTGIEFRPIGLAEDNGRHGFVAPADPNEGSFTIGTAASATDHFECRAVSSLAAERGWSEIDLLKLDIEGFEYGVLADLLRNGPAVRQICVEFHHFMPNIALRSTLAVLRDLHSAGFRIIHKHGCDYTLLRTQ